LNALGIPSTDAIPNLSAPLLIAGAGEQAKERYFEFFAAQIRNRNTRAAYLQAAHQFFGWCETLRLTLAQIRPLHVAAYVEGRQRDLSAPSIKQHLVGLRMLFNWLVTGQVLPSNPALFVKGIWPTTPIPHEWLLPYSNATAGLPNRIPCDESQASMEVTSCLTPAASIRRRVVPVRPTEWRLRGSVLLWACTAWGASSEWSPVAFQLACR
jgi:Phage integrase, N-terminal SAM-like domain